MIKTKREINNIWNTNPFAIAWRKKLQRNKVIIEEVHFVDNYDYDKDDKDYHEESEELY